MSSEGATTVVKLVGAITVERAAGLRAELIEALAGSGEVTLEVSEAEELDLAGVQVLYSARKTAKAAGKRLRLAGTAAPRIAKRLAACGFLQASSGRAEDFETLLVEF